MTRSGMVDFVKNITYIPAILVGLSMESYAILAVLMVIDTLFGVIRVGVIYGGHHIQSYKLTAGVLSKLTVIGIPLLIVWAGRGINIDLLPLAKAMLGILVLAETYSIMGSVYAIRIGRDVPEWDAVSWILRRVQGMIENIIRKEVGKQPTDPDLVEGKRNKKYATDQKKKYDEVNTNK